MSESVFAVVAGFAIWIGASVLLAGLISRVSRVSRRQP